MKKRRHNDSSQVQGGVVSNGKEKQTRESDVKTAVRTLAAGYLGYLAYQLITDVFSGVVSTEDLSWIVVSIVLFSVGAGWLIWPELKHIKEALDSDERQQ